MEIPKYMIGLLVFGGIMSMMLLVITDINQNYALDIDNSSIQNFTANVAIVDDIVDLQREQLLGGDLSILDTASFLFRASYSAVRLVGQTLVMPITILYAVGDILDIPEIWITIAVISTIISILFALVYLIFRFQNK